MKYGHELELDSPNGPLFNVNGKFGNFFEPTCFHLYITKKLLVFFCHLYAHALICSSHYFYPPNEIVKNKFFLPWNREKGFSSVKNNKYDKFLQNT